MRKITLFFAALLVSMTAFSATLYLTPNANWKIDNARFAAYFFGNGETWVSMTAVEGETDLYSVEAPAGYPNVIFCRMNPGATANNWNNKWNQTSDLTVPTDGTNHYTVKDGTWDKGGGTWTTYAPNAPITYTDITITVVANAQPKIHYWDGGDKMVGSDVNAKPSMVATGVANTYSYTIKDVNSALGVKYHLVVGDVQSADLHTTTNVTANFKDLLPQVAVMGVNNWDGTDKMTVSDDYKTATITLNLAAKTYEWKLTVNSEWFGGSKYAITRDKNSIAVTDNGDGNGKLTADLAGEYVFTYTYATKNLTVTYPELAPAIKATWSIEEGAELESFSEVTITFTGVEAANTTTMYPICFYKVAADGTTTPVANDCTAGLLNRKASGTSITLMVQEDEYDFCYDGKITAGNYRIVLSAGMVKFNNDNANKNTEDYVLNFSIKGSGTPALEEIDAVYTVNPENNATVTEIREIVLNFTGYETIAVAEPDMVNGSNIPTVYFEDELTGSMMPAGYIMFKADTASANGLRLYVDPMYTGGAESYAAEGKYVINIPAGVVTFSNGISKAITLNYTVKAEVGPVITEMEAKNAYAYDVKVEANEDKTVATVSYRLNAPAVAVKVYAKVEGEVVREVEGTTLCRYADGVADNLNTVEVSLEGLEEYAGKALTFAVEVTGTLVENPTLVPVSYGFYHSQGVDVDVNPESEYFGRAYVTECAPDGIGKDYHSSITGQGLYAFDALLAPIANKDGNYGFKGGLTTDAASKDPRKVRISEDGRVFLTRQAITGVSPLVEVNPTDLNANFADVFVDFTHDAETYELKTADGKYMASPNIAFDVKGQGEDLKVFMLSTTKAGIAYNPRGNFAKEYNLGTSTTWSAEPSATIDALDTLTHYTINYLGVSVEYDNEGGIWYAQYRATPKESEPTLIHVNAQGVEDYKDFTFVSRSSAIRFNNDFSLLAIAGNGGKKCTIFKVEKDAEGKPVLNKQYEFAVNGNNINDMAWDYANNLYIVNSSSELLYMYAMPRESAVVTTPAASRYAVQMPLPMEVEFENIAAIYEMGMWDMAYYENYDNYNVVALLKSQPTVVDKVVTSGMMGGNMNNYYLNDGTGVIVLQAEGDRYEPITDENWDVIGWDTIAGLNIEVGKKLPVDFMANIDFKVVTDEETWLPTGEVYGAPVMTFVPKATGDIIVDETGWETIVTESNEEFVARCEASDFVEVAVEANLDDVLANRIDYAGKLLVLDTTANYYAAVNPWMGSMSAYMYWDASEAFDVEVSEEEGETYVTVLPKYTEDNNNFVGKLFNVIGEELPEAAFDAAATINVVNARFDWNSIAQCQTLLLKEGYEVVIPESPKDNVENNDLEVNIYSNNGSVYVETEAGAMIEVYTVNGLRVYAGVSNTNTTIINGLNTNIAIIRVNGETYKVFVK